MLFSHIFSPSVSIINAKPIALLIRLAPESLVLLHPGKRGSQGTG